MGNALGRANTRRLDKDSRSLGPKPESLPPRASSREIYGTLLKEGVQIYEYEPAMIHVKALMVDDCWSVLGSTNFDYRSFDLNDEVNLAVLDRDLTRRLTHDFERDAADSRRIDYDEWRRKGRFRLAEKFFSLLEEEFRASELVSAGEGPRMVAFANAPSYAKLLAKDSPEL